MNKKIKLLALLGITVSCGASVILSKDNVKMTADESAPIMHRVDFFNNYLRQDFVLSNGTKGKGNNLLYKTVEVENGTFISKPDDPYRKNYEFKGWFKEKECENEWNFTSDMVLGNTRLFAKWGYAEVQEEQEPAYIPPSTVLEGGTVDYVVASVMNFKYNSGAQLKLPTAAIKRLEAHADNVLPLMEYKVKADKTITATYAANTITVTCGTSVDTISVKDNSGDYLVDNSTYETKAKNYENKIAEEDENYHVMLAGSSSIEFWTSSKEDLDPVVSYNHGIGGTTIEEWDEKLNQRLVYPYKPKMVVYYVGINNVINSKQDATTIWNNLEKFFNDTHAALPDTKVQYIMMNLIPGYSSYWNVINTVNAKVTEYQQSNSWLTLINPGTALLKANGEPNAAYFRTDGLHLSYYGYVVWGGIIKESILRGLENN